MMNRANNISVCLKAESWKGQLDKLTYKEDDLRTKFHEQAEAHREKMSTLENKLRVLESENLELKGKFESVSALFRNLLQTFYE